MSHDLKNVDLPGHALNIANIGDFVLFENFDRHFLPSEGVCSNFDLSECTFAKITAYK